MARAKICDRCGGVYGRNDYTSDFGQHKYGTVKGVCVMFDDVPPDGKNAYMDLCDDCAKSRRGRPVKFEETADKK